MPQPDETTDAQRIAHALKDMEAKRILGKRITFTEIMAIHSAPAAVLFQDMPELAPRRCGALEQ